MSRNSVTGRFRDIEISFSIAGAHTHMSVQNLVSHERHVRVMYQKLAMSGLANWRQFQLTDTPVLLRLPSEVLKAYRLTFFIDSADPISARVENVLAELETLRDTLPAEDLVADAEPVPESSFLDAHSDGNGYTLSTTPQQAEKVIVPREPEPVTAEAQRPHPLASKAEAGVPVDPQIYIEAPPPAPKLPEDEPIPTSMPDLSETSVVDDGDANVTFEILVPALPPSALAARRKSDTENAASRAASKQKKGNGLFGQVVQVFGFSGTGKRGKAYYQERGEAIQDEFQDKLSKLERDYNEGYGLNLSGWEPETLSEEETAILILNLMVNEVMAWEKEIGRATRPETKQLVETLTEVGTKLRQTLKQTRGTSAPSPTLFPDLLAVNEQDLEKIQDECDAYLQRFTQKLIEQEQQHAAKIETVVFKKFLVEFVRDLFFVEIAKCIGGKALPKRLAWFLDLIDSEAIPIAVGETQVTLNHHRVREKRSSEFESGTIIEVVTHGLQSKAEKHAIQMAVVIEAE